MSCTVDDVRRTLVAFAASLVLVACATGAASALPPVGVVWAWQSTQFADARRVDAAQPARYTIEFMPDGTLRVRADCNLGSARYALDGENLSLGPIATTKKGCQDDTQDRVFLAGLEQARALRSDDRALVLTLAGGSMRFAPLAR